MKSLEKVIPILGVCAGSVLAISKLLGLISTISNFEVYYSDIDGFYNVLYLIGSLALDVTIALYCLSRIKKKDNSNATDGSLDDFFKQNKADIQF